jgi:acyl carrier protein
MPTSSKPALTREQVHELLWSLAAKHTDRDPSTIQSSSRLVQDLGADSLEVVELTMALEETLGMTLPDEVADNPDLTLGEIEQAIDKQCVRRDD